MPPLSSKGPVLASRKWRTSLQVPFGAQMIWEKFSCSSSNTFAANSPQIRLLLNGSPLPLTLCKEMDKKFGSCTFQDFVDSNKGVLALKWGDGNWNETCGNPGF